VNVPLNGVPSTGLEQWFPLENEANRSRLSGKIKLRLRLTGGGDLRW
jgi:hypothetical protein